MPGTATSHESLIRRLRRFFEDAPEERRPLTSFIEELNEVSSAVIFGGLIRDVCLHGVKKFKSDVDIVVRCQDSQAFERFIQSRNVQKNKFGGYRLQVSRWLVDIWEFENTWAFSNGFIDPVDEKSLLETTFFNWDAIFYDVLERQLEFRDGYFDDLSNKVLDMNLEDNPNELGAFIRTLRLVSKNSAKTSRGLTEFMLSSFDKTLDCQILNYEKNHFQSSLLTEPLLSSFRESAPLWCGAKQFMWMQEPQQELFDLAHSSH